MSSVVVDGMITTKQIRAETIPHFQMFNGSVWCELYVSGNNLMFKNGAGTYTISMS
jgi:hypothetical protein